MTNDEIKSKIDSHSLWLRTNGAEGEQADFSGEDLRSTNLSLANLAGAELAGANLSGAILTGTILKKTVSFVSPSFAEGLQAKISEIESFLDMRGMKLASPISVLPK